MSARSTRTGGSMDDALSAAANVQDGPRSLETVEDDDLSMKKVWVMFRCQFMVRHGRILLFTGIRRYRCTLLDLM